MIELIQQRLNEYEVKNAINNQGQTEASRI